VATSIAEQLSDRPLLVSDRMTIAYLFVMLTWVAMFEIEVCRSGSKRRCHVWMAPADQGLFFGVALVVGAVMSSAFLCGELSPLALMLSADPLPRSRQRARCADNAAGFRINPLSCASPLGHPRFLCCQGSWSAWVAKSVGAPYAGISR